MEEVVKFYSDDSWMRAGKCSPSVTMREYKPRNITANSLQEKRIHINGS
jgi:hypothetical protein